MCEYSSTEIVLILGAVSGFATALLLALRNTFKRSKCCYGGEIDFINANTPQLETDTRPTFATLNV